MQDGGRKVAVTKAGRRDRRVLAQDDHFDATASVTIGAYTSNPTEADPFRVAVEPSDRNGLRARSRLVDKITTVPGADWGREPANSTMRTWRLNRAMLVFFGLAGSTRSCAEVRTTTLGHAAAPRELTQPCRDPYPPERLFAPKAERERSRCPGINGISDTVTTTYTAV